MTEDRRFKQAVRRRAQSDGTSYSEARASMSDDLLGGLPGQDTLRWLIFIHGRGTTAEELLHYCTDPGGPAAIETALRWWNDSPDLDSWRRGGARIKRVEDRGDGKLALWVDVAEESWELQVELEATHPFRLVNYRPQITPRHGRPWAELQDAIGSHRAVPRSQLSRADRQRVADVVDSWMTTHAVPGLAVGILDHSRPVHVEVRGLADVSRERPVSETTLFGTGSVTKVVIALALLELQDRGTLTLDALVAHHLESIRVDTPEGWNPPTIRDVLTHTAGFPARLGRREWATSAPRNIQEVTGDSVCPVAPPARAFEYSNLGYALLGALISDVTEQSLAEAIRELVFEPIGLQHSSISEMAAPRLGSGDAHGHLSAHGLVAVSPPTVTPYLGSAGLVTNLRDFQRLVSWLLAAPRRRLAQMVERTVPHWEREGREARQGLGLATFRYGSRYTVHHGGSLNGFSALMSLAPGAGVAVVVLANTIGYAKPSNFDLQLLDAVGIV